MYAQIPPKVEYALIPLGVGLITPLIHHYDWANTGMLEMKASRELYEKPVTI